jgi:endonuclease YncB( thermonuclease family)
MARMVWVWLSAFAGGALAAVWLASDAPFAAAPRPGDSDLVLPATVVRVIDGDSLAVQLASGPMEVRLHGADTPEWKQPFGRQAKEAMRRRLKDGQAIELLPVEQDRYDRMVAVVYANGASVNEALIADGMAWAYRQYLGQLEDGARYCELEAAARAARRGLWSQPPALWVPPWIYRARQDAPPGAKRPSRDYSRETAEDCIAAIRRSVGTDFKSVPRLAEPGRAPGAGPCRIKGNINDKGTKIYHVPGNRDYDNTRIDPSRGERWFCTEEEARQAGWRAVR